MNIPKEIWFLEHTDIDAGSFVPPIDSGECFLAFLSEQEAKEGAAFQNEEYDLDCRPVRVK